MATPDESPYGGGAGGKFRKRPFRRSQTTPYDRPPTALRNPSFSGNGGGVGGWFSRFLTNSAHRIFDSVFRKRILPSPSPPPPHPRDSTEGNQEHRDTPLQEATFANPSEPQEQVVWEDGRPNNNPSSDEGYSELEQILKQKTFTRFEIDRLTALLHSKTVDQPVGNEEKRSETDHSTPVAPLIRRDELENNGIQGYVIENHTSHAIISTPVSSKVIEDDIASPAELAKAYMGSRPSKVSPSMLGLRSQVFREDTSLLPSMPFPPKSPAMTLAPKSVQFGVHGNGSMTSRSRGRSAIYSMARSPYFGVPQNATHKDSASGSMINGYGGASSSSQWENNNTSASKRAALKRRSSFLDDDIGSGGPTRRLRQKTNLLGLPASATAGGSSAVPRHVSYVEKPVLIGESKNNSSKLLLENGHRSSPGNTFRHVPSQSTEMAEKILEQLDKLVPSPKEKSPELKLATVRSKPPSKLTTSMLRGQALRSLEHIDSSKFFTNVQNSKESDSPLESSLPESSTQKQDKIEDNGPTRTGVCSDRLVDSLDTVGPTKKAADSAPSKFVALPPPTKKRAFRISALEDYVELDDDHSNGTAVSAPLAEGKKFDGPIIESKISVVEAVSGEKSPALSEVKSPSSYEAGKGTDLDTSDKSAVSEKSSAFTFQVAPASAMTAQPAVLPTLPKEPNAPSLFGFGAKDVDKVPSSSFVSSSTASGSSGFTFGAWSNKKVESSNSFATVSAGETESIPKANKVEEEGSDKIQKSDDVYKKPEIAVSSTTLTSIPLLFGAPANNSTPSNGSLVSNPFIFSSPTQPVNTPTLSPPTTTTITTAAIPTTTTSAPAPSPTTSIFKFGSSTTTVPTPSISPPPVSSSTESKASESNGKPEPPPSFGNLTNTNPFGALSSTSVGTGSSIFGFTSSAMTSTTSSQSQSSIFGFTTTSISSTSNPSQSSSPFGSGSSPLPTTKPSGESIASTFSNTIPVQFNSSASSGSSFFSSTTPSIFGSTTTFSSGPSASSSEATPISTTTTTSSPATSSIFGSSFTQPAKSPIFGLSPSTGFSFGASTNAAPPMVFGSPTTAASSGSMFSFTSPVATTATTTTTAQPAFANPFTFGGSANNNNDQMNMEDSMAEDTVQASMPVTPVFGQSPSPPGFMFGGSTTPLASSFQFGGQPNPTTPQNPFQASGSLGGSFSLGTGGGGDKSSRKMIKVKHKSGRKK